jgi:hypothetical protein
VWCHRNSFPFVLVLLLACRAIASERRPVLVLEHTDYDYDDDEEEILGSHIHGEKAWVTPH